MDALPLILTFVAAIVMFAAFRCFREIFHQQVNAIASIVTVIGVLGTFIGIFIGLYSFDTDNIEASVPALLEGLKFAFLSSIFGITGSIWLKWLALNNQKKQAKKKTYSGATINDLANTLQKIYLAQSKEGDETRETLRTIEKALTGDGDSTVLTQLQKLRTSFSDKQDDLIQAFNEFAAQMAENNTKALIEALEEVMRDFNTKINEQFGDNFRQLNQAVGRINDWQEQYRQHMDELAAEFRIAAESIEKSRQSLEIIAERSDTIVSGAEKLDPILQAIQHQIQQLNSHLESFSALADNAGNAFPIIEGRLNQLTDNFSQVVTEMINNSHEDTNRQREALQNFTGQIEQVIHSTSQSLENTLKETNQELENTLQTQSTQLGRIVENTSRQLSTETERIFRESTDRMTQQVQVLDTSLQQELTKTLESLGSQLTSLSRRFVEDYSPLTDQLRKVVQMAEDLSQTGR